MTTTPPPGPPGDHRDGDVLQDAATAPRPPATPLTSHGDLVAGGIFVVLGAAFSVAAVGYGLGSWREMGAGMFPFVLGVLMAGLGVGVVVTGLRGGELTPGLSRVPWRGVLCVGGALVYFAFAVPYLGFLPATAGTVLLSCLASPTTSIAKALLATAGITAACYVVFVLLLQLRLPLVGS